MPGVLTNVIKGQMLNRVDTRLSRGAGETPAAYATRLEAIRELFATGKSHLEVGKTRITHGQDTIIVRNSTDESHTRDEFFGDGGAKSFFPNIPGDEEDEVVRGTFVRALDLAIEAAKAGKPLPVATYWVVTGREDTDVAAIEGYVAKTPSQIDVLILTPQPAYEPPSPADRETVEEIWAIGTSAHIANLVARLRNAGGGAGYPVNKVPLAGVNGAECLQVVGY